VTSDLLHEIIRVFFKCVVNNLIEQEYSIRRKFMNEVFQVGQSVDSISCWTDYNDEVSLYLKIRYGSKREFNASDLNSTKVWIRCEYISCVWTLTRRLVPHELKRRDFERERLYNCSKAQERRHWKARASRERQLYLWLQDTQGSPLQPRSVNFTIFHLSPVTITVFLMSLAWIKPDCTIYSILKILTLCFQ